MTDILFTRGQLERKLSQEIQSLYRRHLGHQPSKVTCQIFDAKLAVIIEGSITNAEQILIEEGKKELAEEVHSNLDNSIELKLRELIENVAEVEIIDLLSDATLDTGRTGIIAVLNNTPKVRNPNAIPKVKK
jgi:uncharacterized protein YbcI